MTTSTVFRIHLRHGLMAMVAFGLLSACGQGVEELPAVAAAEAEGRTITGGEPFHGLLEYRQKDAKLALIRPVFVTADEARLASGVSVVGVSVGDQHRAYPLYVLKNHQVVNDRVGDVPVAASW